MNFTQLLILQFIAHFLTDFAFQPDNVAKDKNKSGFRSRFLKWHTLIVFLLSWILSFQWSFIYGALVITLSHWLVDGFKKRLYDNPKLKIYAFFIDQALHVLFILLVVSLFTHFFEIKPLFDLTLTTKSLFLIAGFLFCTKPANILIKEIFIAFEINVNQNGDESNDLPNAGKLIGIIERWLVLIFILLNQFEAVGFLIAAKSILRYKEGDTLKTEYVLIGTMLSFAIAIAIGVAIDFVN